MFNFLYNLFSMDIGIDLGTATLPRLLISFRHL